MAPQGRAVGRGSWLATGHSATGLGAAASGLRAGAVHLLSVAL